MVIYDSSISQPISSIEFSSPVLGLTARRDKLVVVLLNRVILFNLSPGHDRAVEQEGEWDTCDNPKGLVSLATHPASTLLIFPGRQFGQVQVVQLPGFDPYQASAPPVHPPRQAPYPTTTILLAHTTALAALTITPNGQLIATASVTGTLIRVWDAKTSKLVHELRRGTDGAAVWSLRFRPDGLAICASSDKGTIHLWHLLNPNPTTHGTKKPSLESDSMYVDLIPLPHVALAPGTPIFTKEKPSLYPHTFSLTAVLHDFHLDMFLSMFYQISAIQENSLAPEAVFT